MVLWASLVKNTPTSEKDVDESKDSQTEAIQLLTEAISIKDDKKQSIPKRVKNYTRINPSIKIVAVFAVVAIITISIILREKILEKYFIS